MLPSKLTAHYKKIIVILVVVVFVIFSNCIIDGKIVCRLGIIYNAGTVTDKDVDNIRGFYFLKKFTIADCRTNDLSFLENKKYMTYFSLCAGEDSEPVTDWKYLSDCTRLKDFTAEGNCKFSNLECFSKMPDIEKISITSVDSLDGLQKISKSLKSLTIDGMENEEYLNLERFTNLRTLNIQNTSVNEILVSSYIENLNISNNPSLKKLYLPANAGTPENITADNTPKVKFIYYKQ